MIGGQVSTHGGDVGGGLLDLWEVVGEGVGEGEGRGEGRGRGGGWVEMLEEGCLISGRVVREKG